MKTSSKIFFDKYFAGSFAKMLNLFVIPLGKILKIDHDLNKDFKRIAVCKYKGMGSIIQATPLLETLKKNFPQAEITFISSKENKAIINQIPSIDNSIYIDDSKVHTLIFQLFPFIRKLIRKKFEVYIDLEVYSNFSTMISILSKSKNRFGFYLNSKHYRLGNYTHMMYYNTRSAISETYLQFARLLACKDIHHNLNIRHDNISTERVEKLLNYDFTKENYILINPNASDLRIERKWPEENFIQLCKTLRNNNKDLSVFLLGSPSESQYVDQILKKLPDTSNIQSLAGKTNIPELISIIKHARLFITNDTGPMHIAFSTNTPTLALFGPCSPNQYGINSNCFPVYENLYCSPCVHEFISPPCKGNNRCMKSINPEKIIKYTEEILDNGKRTETNETHEIIYQYQDFTIGKLSRQNQ